MFDEELTYKIVILSYNDTGKTNLINRYMNNGKEIKVELWDTASGETFKSLNRIFVRGAKGLIFLYDISYQRSLNEAIDYFNFIKSEISDDVIIALVGNKIDIDYDNNSYYSRKITIEEGQRIANENNFLFFEVSAKNGINVDECFHALIQRIYENDPNTINEHRILNEKKNTIQLRNNRAPKRGCLK